MVTITMAPRVQTSPPRPSSASYLGYLQSQIDLCQKHKKRLRLDLIVRSPFVASDRPSFTAVVYLVRSGLHSDGYTDY
ncbi:hypothetical protein EYF80_035551 [Liparis tanakae]|uniref:Uncharacterized protein n=1 Tax=Liparis tanakae TaxID=230148 RepID=A0A4Z2GLZ9_9TELE|nr:hypothetical protein EYF80_035551 [Liparis tanakae]